MKMQRNARICTAFFPLWSIPYTIYNYYLSLFLLAKGVTETQLGLLMSMTNISALVCALIASPIVDKLGRKRATLIFDLISSALPPLLFFISQNFVVAMVAMAVSGLNRIMSVGYYLLMIEDTDESNSMAAMNWFNLILVASGLLTSLAGLIVARYGLIRSESAFLLISFICMVTLDLCRNAMVRETPTGMKIMKEKKTPFSLTSLVDSYRDTFRYLGTSRRASCALCVNAIVYVYYTIGTSISLFFTPYFSVHAGLEGSKLGMVGTVYAVGTLVSMLLINPRITHRNIYFLTILSSLTSILGFGLLILCPKGNDIQLFGALVIIAVSYGMLKTIADSLLAIETEGNARSGVYAFSFILSSILSLLAIQAVQKLYAVSPNWLFGSSAILMVMVIIVCLILKLGEKKNG